MSYFDIELIDVSDNVENFTFTKVPGKCLEQLLDSFEGNKSYLKFTCTQGNVLLDRKFFRGIMHIPHIEKQKTVIEETMEAAEEVSKIQIVKKNKPKVIAK